MFKLSAYSIKAGNKKEVQRVLQKLSNDSHYTQISKCFFVDKDMDEYPTDRNEDLYITPCYSIENLYTTTNVLSNILQSEFSCDKNDADHQKCIDRFIQLQNQFNEIMIEYNALVLLRNQKGLGNGKVRLSNFKTSKLFAMDIEKVQKHTKYNEEITKFKASLSANEAEISGAITTIKNLGNYNTTFRGKNQLDFFVSFIMLLKKLHNTQVFFEHTHTCVTINLTNNRLSELSQYAEFPSCLKEFLEKHKISA